MNKHTQTVKTEASLFYQIELEGILDQDWSSWLCVTHQEHLPQGNTVLVGTVTDQAMLHGLLNRIRDLGIPILLIKRLDPLGSLPKPSD